MSKVRCPQGYRYNSNTMNCDPVPKVRGQLRSDYSPTPGIKHGCSHLNLRQCASTPECMVTQQIVEGICISDKERIGTCTYVTYGGHQNIVPQIPLKPVMVAPYDGTWIGDRCNTTYGNRVCNPVPFDVCVDNPDYVDPNQPQCYTDFDCPSGYFCENGLDDGDYGDETSENDECGPPMSCTYCNDSCAVNYESYESCMESCNGGVDCEGDCQIDNCTCKYCKGCLDGEACNNLGCSQGFDDGCTGFECVRYDGVEVGCECIKPCNWADGCQPQVGDPNSCCYYGFENDFGQEVPCCNGCDEIHDQCGECVNLDECESYDTNFIPKEQCGHGIVCDINGRPQNNTTHECNGKPECNGCRPQTVSESFQGTAYGSIQQYCSAKPGTTWWLGCH